MSSASTEASGKARRTLLLLLPLAVFAALAVLFLVGLGSGDPSRLPSVLIGHPAPKTYLPPLAGLTRDGKPVPGLSNAAFPGELTLVNVWASWCIPCADEVPFLEKLSHDKRIKLVGINYKDPADNARRFLNRYGNPFAAVGVDANGRTAIDWGVYGVPETYLVDRTGTIVYKLVGPVTADNLANALDPEIAKAMAKTAAR
jgi:cytochrome c biogenesis protein CcmG/thiol:disulfide interchange protein DsbE